MESFNKRTFTCNEALESKIAWKEAQPFRKVPQDLSGRVEGNHQVLLACLRTTLSAWNNGLKLLLLLADKLHSPRICQTKNDRKRIKMPPFNTTWKHSLLHIQILRILKKSFDASSEGRFSEKVPNKKQSNEVETKNRHSARTISRLSGLLSVRKYKLSLQPAKAESCIERECAIMVSEGEAWPSSFHSSFKCPSIWL
jgi:hypothetical protein